KAPQGPRKTALPAFKKALTDHRNPLKILRYFTPRFFQHPSSVSALRADPPSPTTRAEGRADLART
ncbi:MAG: hypothetical protein EOR96_33320, partial [Mesorhizobium sp.]